ncbi:glycoside hydrolase family 97 catalytic domain-containing protein [Streptomyces bobili]|uniref:glycoside hydrolase family 97 catalytic domain-containing protein n=1 Tax=Streptomyces bobili TaxID=67280 RepID=UPI0033ACDCA8
METTSTVTAPFTTPWRVVVIRATHAELVDNAELVLNLAPPAALTDTSWIKPGKVFRCELTTAAGLAGVDFVVARGLQYIEYDGGWYGPVTSPAAHPIPEGDLPSVISYATDHGIGVILYADRTAVGDADSLFALYQSWGTAGVKLGLVLDGTQSMTNQIIPLSFLDDGMYTATVYTDGEPGSSPIRTPVVVNTRTVTEATTLDVAMASAGGQAIILKRS